jgi:hypothetical protein
LNFRISNITDQEESVTKFRKMAIKTNFLETELYKYIMETIIHLNGARNSMLPELAKKKSKS